jgi:DNA-binding LacI/PurR family transcriptional regulator
VRGANRTTLADVAADAGVSVSTASLAFSGAGPVAPATRERVLASAARIGYRGPNPVARSLRRGQAGVIAVVVGDRLQRSFTDPVSAQTLDGIAQELGDRELGLLLVPSDTFGDAPALLRHGAMDAAIIAGLSAPGDAALQTLRERGVPVVCLEATRRDAATIGLEDRAGTAELTRRLLALGHSRIAVVTLPFGPQRRRRFIDPEDPPRAAYTPTRNRWAGVRDAGVVPVLALEPAMSLVEEGVACGHLLLDRADRPTAVIAFSDLLAAGVLLAARELGLRVPQDVSIAGFDGVDLPWLAPDVLTSVSQPLTEKGHAAAQAAADLTAGGTPRHLLLPVTPRPGTTTGPVRR